MIVLKKMYVALSSAMRLSIVGPSTTAKVRKRPPAIMSGMSWTMEPDMKSRTFSQTRFTVQGCFSSTSSRASSTDPPPATPEATTSE